jgi:hypothetical protein
MMVRSDNRQAAVWADDDGQWLWNVQQLVKKLRAMRGDKATRDLAIPVPSSLQSRLAELVTLFPFLPPPPRSAGT